MTAKKKPAKKAAPKSAAKRSATPAEQAEATNVETYSVAEGPNAHGDEDEAVSAQTLAPPNVSPAADVEAELDAREATLAASDLAGTPTEDEDDTGDPTNDDEG